MADKTIGQFAFSMNNKVGSGSFGEVFKGKDLKTGREVAVKMMPRRIIDQDEYLKENVFSEIKIMKKLQNPYIVEFIDVFETSNNYYIIQEFCDSGDLAHLLKKVKMLSESEAMQFMINILSGFVELIKHGIIHRDLKPANILINKNQYKIADFGFAKNVDNFQAQMLESAVGTPLYMSPQILNGDSYSSKSDVWSLGFILYETLFGMTPWTGRSIPDLLKEIKSNPLKFSSNINKISELMKDFLMGCLQIEEKNRLSWDEIYRNPIFSDHFQQYVNFNKSLEDKANYLITDIRRHVQTHRIDLTQLFDELDMSKNKVLSIQEFSVLLRKINKDLTRQETEYIFNKIDEDRSNSIEFNEFKKWLMENDVQMSQFQRQDPDTVTKYQHQQSYQNISPQKSNQHDPYNRSSSMSYNYPPQQQQYPMSSSQQNQNQQQQYYPQQHQQPYSYPMKNSQQQQQQPYNYPMNNSQQQQQQAPFSLQQYQQPGISQFGMQGLASKFMQGTSQGSQGIWKIKLAVQTYNIDLEALFRKYDTTNSQTLTLPEFTNMLKRIDQNMPDYEIQGAFRQIDNDNNGSIDFQEFFAAVNTMQQPGPPQQQGLYQPYQAQYYK